MTYPVADTFHFCSLNTCKVTRQRFGFSRGVEQTENRKFRAYRQGDFVSILPTIARKSWVSS